MRNLSLSLSRQYIQHISLRKKGKKPPRNSRVREYTRILTDFFFVLSDKGKAEAVLTFMKEQTHGERRFFCARQEAILFNS